MRHAICLSSLAVLALPQYKRDAAQVRVTLVIDLVDPASGQLLWSGSGVGNTRWGADTGADEPGRMRGVKETVRHIMKDLK